MDRKVTILIADRNPNVREFLKREMVAENYRVICAEDAKTMFKLMFDPFKMDALIIDPDLPDMEPPDVLDRLKIHYPTLPVIVHCLLEENGNLRLTSRGVFIEKGGSSIEEIKRVLRKTILDSTT